MQTKDEILLATTAKEVFEWMQSNPEQADAEVAKHFNKLATKEYLQRNPNPDIIVDPIRRVQN